MATHEVTMVTLTPSSGKGGAEAPLALQSTTPLVLAPRTFFGAKIEKLKKKNEGKKKTPQTIL